MKSMLLLPLLMSSAVYAVEDRYESIVKFLEQVAQKSEATKIFNLGLSDTGRYVTGVQIGTGSTNVLVFSMAARKLGRSATSAPKSKSAKISSG